MCRCGLLTDTCMQFFQFWWSFIILIVGGHQVSLHCQTVWKCVYWDSSRGPLKYRWTENSPHVLSLLEKLTYTQIGQHGLGPSTDASQQEGYWFNTWFEPRGFLFRVYMFSSCLCVVFFAYFGSLAKKIHDLTGICLINYRVINKLYKKILQFYFVSQKKDIHI